MRNLLLPGILMMIVACTPENFSPKLSEVNVQAEYDSLRADNEQRRLWFKKVYASDNATRKKVRVKEAHNYLYRVLRKEVFPRWEGTPWDYNGTSTAPQKGQIACGYFVTTTLAQCGLEIERAKLAQQAASKIIKTLCKPGSLKVIGHNRHDLLLAHLAKQKNGIYIIGLDNHVGFIVKEEEGTFMVHSTAYPHNKVLKEKVEVSKNLKNSNSYYIADLLGNDELLIKWMNGTNIPTL